MTETKKTLRGPGGISVTLDKAEVFLDDPGLGTPAMCRLSFGRGDATYWCAMNEGEVEIGQTGEMKKLTPKQVDWLSDINDEVNLFLYGKKVGG